MRILPATTVVALVTSCATAHVTINDLQNPHVLDDCANGGSAVDVDTQLAIVSELVDSYHEMIVCGGLQLDFQSALINVIANAALGRGGPSQLVYRGHGAFASRNGMMAITASLTNGGGPLDFDLLDPQSYLVGVQVTANAGGVVDAAMRGGSPFAVLSHAAASLDVRFQAEGPGFALLGLSSNEAHLGHLDLKKIENALMSHISLANKVNVDNQQGGTTIHYILEGAPAPLSDLHEGKRVPMTLASIQASHPSTNQTVKVTDWTMEFKGDGGKVLDGTIGMDIEGGAFPYHVQLTYPHDPTPNIKLSCKR